MSERPATLRVTAGPNAGQAISLEFGACRLIGRHLGADETIMTDGEGCRRIDDDAAAILDRHLRDRTPTHPARARISHDTFERGPDILFSDGSISRAHAMLFHDAAGVALIDLASTNGTFVNGERVSAAPLTSGDVLRVGNSDLVLALR